MLCLWHHFFSNKNILKALHNTLISGKAWNLTVSRVYSAPLSHISYLFVAHLGSSCKRKVWCHLQNQVVYNPGIMWHKRTTEPVLTAGLHVDFIQHHGRLSGKLTIVSHSLQKLAHPMKHCQCFVKSDCRDLVVKPSIFVCCNKLKTCTGCNLFLPQC